jgi:hypothetical protein
MRATTFSVAAEPRKTGAIELISSTTAIRRVASRPLARRLRRQVKPPEFTEVSHDEFI